MARNMVFGWWQKHCYKKADKASSLVIWDRVDYLKEANKQLSNKSVYQEVEFKEKMLTELVESSKKFFNNLKARLYILILLEWIYTLYLPECQETHC